MGFLDFLFGGNKRKWQAEIAPDQIWLTEQAKFDGIAAAIRSANGNSPAILLVAHFGDTLSHLQMLAHEHAGGASMMATLTETLPTSWLSGRDGLNVRIIVGERHPLRATDDQVLEFAEKLCMAGATCRVGFHISLDDPLMQVFAGDWVKGMLQRLGMTEDEAISSKSIDRRVEKAQRQFSATSIGNRPAGSAAEWLALNMPASQ